MDPRLKNEKATVVCGLQDTTELAAHLRNSGAGVAEGVGLAGGVLANSVAVDGQAVTTLGLPVTHTSSAVVRARGAFDPGETGSTLLCWGNASISFFDLKRWFCE